MGQCENKEQDGQLKSNHISNYITCKLSNILIRSERLLNNKNARPNYKLPTTDL